MTKLHIQLDNITFFWNVDRDDGSFFGGALDIQAHELLYSDRYLLILECVDMLKRRNSLSIEIDEVVDDTLVDNIITDTHGDAKMVGENA